MDNIDTIISQTYQQLEECEKRAYDLDKKVREWNRNMYDLISEIHTMIQMKIIKHFDVSYSLHDLNIFSEDVRKIYWNIEEYKAEINHLEKLIEGYRKNIKKIKHQFEECRTKGDVKTLNEIANKVEHMHVLINKYEKKFETTKQQILKILETLA